MTLGRWVVLICFLAAWTESVELPPWKYRVLLVHSGHPLLGFGDLPQPPGTWTFSNFVAGMYTHFSSVWIVLPGFCLL